MTAELVLMNRFAAVLAADSAVTLSGYRGAPIKSYNTASKIFSVTKDPPVGAMVFGDINSIPIPWGTLLTLFRQHLSKNAEATESVASVAQEFFSWIDQNRRYFNRPEEERQYEDALADAFFTLRTKVLEFDPGASLLEQMEAFADARLQEISDARGMTEEWSAAVKAKGPGISNAISALWGKLDLNDPNVKEKMEKVLASEVALSLPGIRGRAMGVVFAGVGADEIYPSMSVYDIDGVIGGRVLAWHNKELSRSISPEHRVEFLPFAQADGIRIFMEGIDPTLAGTVQSIVESLPLQVTNELIGYMSARGIALEPEVRAQMQSIAAGVAEGVKPSLRKWRLEHSNPMRATLEHLPIAELAAVASRFLDMAALHYRVRPVTDSVGGPIDVVAISKRDGFVWTSRKQYFSMELNPDYVVPEAR